MTIGRLEQQRVWNVHAAHIKSRDEFSRALRVMRRFPLYTVFGASRHHLLNGDVFDREQTQLTKFQESMDRAASSIPFEPGDVVVEDPRAEQEREFIAQQIVRRDDREAAQAVALQAEEARAAQEQAQREWDEAVEKAVLEARSA